MLYNGTKYGNQTDKSQNLIPFSFPVLCNCSQALYDECLLIIKCDCTILARILALLVAIPSFHSQAYRVSFSENAWLMELVWLKLYCRETDMKWGRTMRCDKSPIDRRLIVRLHFCEGEGFTPIWCSFYNTAGSVTAFLKSVFFFCLTVCTRILADGLTWNKL